MSIGIILVHGYTGSHTDLTLPYDILSEDYGIDNVTNLCLPWHDTDEVPEFDRDKYIECLESAVHHYKRKGSKIIFIGHSTGGNIILEYLAESLFVPHLLILACTPKHINGSYLERWNVHNAGKKEIPLTSIAKMVRAVNISGSCGFDFNFPVIILHGEKDELVPVETASLWKNSFIHVQLHKIPDVGHDLFSDKSALLAIDIIRKHISGICGEKGDDHLNILLECEPGIKEFLEYSPSSYRHIAYCPSAGKLFNKPVKSEPVSGIEPVIANIEVTTKCGLRCKYCGRTLYGKEGRNMSLDTYAKIMSLLQHAYKITLVGLGEPLMHPDIAGFVKEARSQKRHIGLVTNGMFLTENISEQLIDTGLNSIAFSIDTTDQSIADKIRGGSDVSVIIGNIKNFMNAAKGSANLTAAIFCALSVDNLSSLERLIDVAASLGVKAIMMTDLNFEENVSSTLYKNRSPECLLALKKAITHSFSEKLPVLSVHALEEFGLSKRYRDFLLLNPGKLLMRSSSHANCMSPWQTIVVNVDGNITVCDCQANRIAGNILEMPLNEIWNGKVMREHREAMKSYNIPQACGLCPRF